MRGIFAGNLGYICRGWIIPADAGHFQDVLQELNSKEDHPRRCGAFFLSAVTAPARAGSSPQVRGIWTERGVQLSITGIIPAGAGHL